MSNTDKDKNELVDDEAERLYQIYIQVQSGDNAALNELFKQTDYKRISKADKINKAYWMSHMDHVLDMEFIWDNEKNEREKEWIDSVDSKVSFQFSCLNKMLYKKKKEFLSKTKNTGYENGKKKKNHSYSKFYEGEYDVSDFNELMYETVIEIFNTKTDDNNCLTLDGKKNIKNPICDGVSLLENISYYTSRKMNQRAKMNYLDLFDMGYYSEESETELSCFDQYVMEEFLQSGSGTSRLLMYAEYLEWLKRNDVHKLFKATSSNIKVIIETIMNCKDTFIADVEGDRKTGFGMRFVTQETLREIMKFRHNINIEQENISKDLELIEQRLLEHLFYSLNYRIDKAAEGTGIYEQESKRFLYELDKKAYVKLFDRASYELYEESVKFISNGSFDSYFMKLRKYEDMVMDIVSLEKGKKKYDMVNLMIEENNDLVENEKATIWNIANTIIEHYQKAETEYQRKEWRKYKIKGFSDWGNAYWEVELCDKILKIKLFSSEKIKKPIQYNINREKLMVYCGCINFYFCDVEKEVYYKFPKNRRIISRANKNHEILMYQAG